MVVKKHNSVLKIHFLKNINILEVSVSKKQ